MLSASNLAISGSLPVGCCLIARHPIHGVSASRLIHVQADPSGQKMVWLVDLESEALPIIQALPHVMAEIAAGSLTVWHWTPRIRESLRKSMSPNALEQAEIAWQRIRPLTGLQQMPVMLDSKQRGQLLARQAKTIGCNRTQLYRDWSRYLRWGMTPDALVPRIARWSPPPWPT
jgi:hypothetical protein